MCQHPRGKGGDDGKSLLLNRMPWKLTKGGFLVRKASEWVEEGDIRYVEL